MADLPRHLDPDAPPPSARYCLLTIRTGRGDQLGVTEQTFTVPAGTDLVTAPDPSIVITVTWPDQ